MSYVTHGYKNDHIYFLSSGLQTKISRQILEIVSVFKNESTENKINHILNIVKSIPFKTENKFDVFRKRTASEIISNNYITGCTDANLIFISLARAANIPTKYVETININSLNKMREERHAYDGHVYSCVYDSDKGWRIIDVTKGKMDVNIILDKRIVVKEGLDSWDIGIASFHDLKLVFDDIRGKFILN